MSSKPPDTSKSNESDAANITIKQNSSFQTAKEIPQQDMGIVSRQGSVNIGRPKNLGEEVVSTLFACNDPYAFKKHHPLRQMDTRPTRRNLYRDLSRKQPHRRHSTDRPESI